MNAAEVDLFDFDTVLPPLPVVVLPINVPGRGDPVRLHAVGLVAHAATWAVSLLRPIRYNVEEVYEAGPNGEDKSRVEVEPFVYVHRNEGRPLMYAWATVDRSAGVSSLNLWLLGHRVEVFFKGRGDTVPLEYPSILR